MNDRDGTWTEYSKLVLSELRRLHESLEELRHDMIDRDKEHLHDLHDLRVNFQNQIQTIYNDIEKINRDLSIKISQLQIKSGWIGAFAGLIPTAILVAVSLLSK